jgi:DNA polymerase-3 subunit gamma/tau
MLSQGAFNALLKTLEEPPAHVIFILCTTELQKVIPTIQSRCQRFDFKAISTLDIIAKLKEIIKIENIEIEEDAIKQIATYAEGGMRDAISLLDQVYAYNPEKISIEDVNQICGAVSMQTQIDLAKALINFESTKAISLLNDLLYQGKEVKKITLNLIEFFRDVLMYSNLKTIDESSLLYDNEEFIKIANTISNRKAFYIIDVLSKALTDISGSNNPKIQLELAFLKISDSEDNSNSNVLAAIDEIEKRLLDLEALKDYVKVKDTEEKQEIIQNIISSHAKTDETDPEVINQATEKIKEIILNTNQDNALAEDKHEEDVEIVEVSLSKEKGNLEEVKKSVDDSKKPEKNLTTEEIKEELCDDINNTYDIVFVEEVLNNGDRKDKISLQNRWQNFPIIENEEDSKYFASLLETGTVVASSYDKLIITFASTTICNTLMIPANKEIVMKIINKKFNRIINYMALPNSVFSEISKEFMERYRQGEQYVKLSKIVCEGLKDVSTVEEILVTEARPKIVQDAIDLFGEIVKVKE